MSTHLKDELALRRSGAGKTPSIDLRLPVDPLADADHCASITARLRAAGQLWERHVAHPNLAAMLPKKSGLYMFVWRPGLRFCVANERAPWQEGGKAPSKDGIESFAYVLYVGKAGDGSANSIKGRYQNGYSKYIGKNPDRLWDGPETSREDRLRRYLSLEPLEFWYMVVEDPAMISPLESALLMALSPPAAAQLRARFTKTAPAFKE